MEGFIFIFLFCFGVAFFFASIEYNLMRHFYHFQDTKNPRFMFRCVAHNNVALKEKFGAMISVFARIDFMIVTRDRAWV